MFRMQAQRKQTARSSAFGLLLLCVCAGAAHAQDGRINGTVHNPAKAAVAGVTVTAINQVTTERATRRTDNGGAFSFKVRPGAYRILVSAPDFQTFDRENIIVEPGQDATVAVELQALPESAKKQQIVDPSEREHPAGYAGGPSAASAPQTDPHRREVRDRWRIAFPEYERYGDMGARGRDIPFRKGKWYNPYDLNLLKGDYPIFGQNTFMILSGVDTFVVQQQRTPIPSNVSSARPGSAEFFGKPEVLAVNHIMQFTLEMFRGDSTFRPRTWAFKISPTLSLPNFVRARETGVINIDTRRGTRRTDTQFSLEEAFAEVKIEDVNANFDFISARVGIQPFVSDARGFLYSDNNLGARLFGGFHNNKFQYNAIAFAQLEKDTNSGLNRFDLRPQRVYIANLFKQDLFRKGYTGQVVFAFNNDRRSVEYDRNGFLVRPALIGDFRPHTVNAGYIGINGDGHLGRINLTNAYYFAFGHDSRNPIAGRKQTIRSNMAAVEASLDKDFFRYRASIFFAQGDKNPTDSKATGFDAIFDDPNFSGGQFSFWNRVGIPLTGAAVGLVQPNSLLPSLRSSKSQGQANFVNPGIFIYNAGVDIDVTQRIKAIINANYLRFHRTESLEYLIFQNRIRHDIGWDLSLGVTYRPLLINNIQLTFGASTLKPRRGFRDIYTDRTRNCPPNVPDYCTSDNVVINPNKPLYALFAQVKFIF
jgi:hypothetical protein